MRKDMGSLLFKGSGSKLAKTRRRFVSNMQVLTEAPTQQPRLQTIDFRLGEEPENCTVVRYLSVRHVSERSGWVTAEVRFAPKFVVLEDEPALDDAHKQESMRGNVSIFRRKTISFSTGAMKRFLGSRVGREWGKVSGEIRRGCDLRSYQGNTVDDLVRGMVVTNVELCGDQLLNVEAGKKLEESPDGCFYFVHPTTGLLQRLPRQSKSAKQKPVQRHEQVDIDALTKMVRVEGVWYVVGFQPLPSLEQLRREQPSVLEDSALDRPKDIILGQAAVIDPANNYRAYGSNKPGNSTVDTFVQEWGMDIYAVSKRQAGRRELKSYLGRRYAA